MFLAIPQHHTKEILMGVALSNSDFKKMQEKINQNNIEAKKNWERKMKRYKKLNTFLVSALQDKNLINVLNMGRPEITIFYEDNIEIAIGINDEFASELCIKVIPKNRYFTNTYELRKISYDHKKRNVLGELVENKGMINYIKRNGDFIINGKAIIGWGCDDHNMFFAKYFNLLDVAQIKASIKHHINKMMA